MQIYTEYINYSTSNNKNSFNSYKNRLTRLIRWAKNIHFEKLFFEAEGSPKKTWTIITECLNKIKSQVLPESMNVSDKSTVTGKQKVAEESSLIALE